MINLIDLSNFNYNFLRIKKDFHHKYKKNMII